MLGLVAIFVAVTLLAWSGTFWLVQREMTSLVDERLNMRMQAALVALDEGRRLPAPADGQSVSLVSEDLPDGFHNVDPLSENEADYRYLVKSTPYGQVKLGENTDRQEELRQILAGGLQVTLLGTLLTTILAGLWMARRGQARLSAINDGLALVAQGKLDTRIALDGRRDDLSLLAGRINTTTERLDQAMTMARVQSSNIAHDLRTPLARLRAQIETSLIALTDQNRPVTEEELGAALEQIDDITNTFNALLRLARIESGMAKAEFAPIDMGALTEQVAEIFGPVVEEAGQMLRIDVTDAAQIEGDHSMLMQLVANLIQNALRHGAQEQVITLQVQGSCLSVSDQGQGIPEHEREKVLAPLYQIENTRQSAGSGLGLAMVRAICDLHEATLSLSDGPQGKGLTVTVQFAGPASGN